MIEYKLIYLLKYLKYNYIFIRLIYFLKYDYNFL